MFTAKALYTLTTANCRKQGGKMVCLNEPVLYQLNVIFARPHNQFFLERIQFSSIIISNKLF